ncbi:hypothetical protein WR25_13802 [Diploscapter pachys]|uniref:Uncharacterized protein n=1 Tax=Diploscapter pachys TaxID=2018661 RepID=A0A2A2J2H6_9BILA|nr:hypothetical protein WR25_13802 [Diploscapter pachys]
MWIFLYILLLRAISIYGFIIGGCIGPKSVLERHLTDREKSELRKLVHTRFDGTNADQVLKEVNSYAYNHVTLSQWQNMLPEIKAYQAKKHECSIYAQLLPKDMYLQLLNSVYRANEMGASKHDVKRLVEDYIDRLIRNQMLPNVDNSIIDPQLPLVSLPPPDVSSQGYRYQPPLNRGLSRLIPPGTNNGFHSYSNRPDPSMVVEPQKPNFSRPTVTTLLPISKYPTLIGYPQNGQEMGNNMPEPPEPVPLFPMINPTINELSKYGPPSWNG